MIEVEDGFLIFFISEGPESLNNQNTQNVLNGPRNLGFIKVSKDLESILSLGSEQRGGYFNLNGQFVDQKNEGVTWLTGFKDSQVAYITRLKAKRIEIDRNLLIFEVWTQTRFDYTGYLVVDDKGRPRNGPW